MGAINHEAVVREQYQNAGRLNTRLSIHNKYSTNKLGFYNWLFSMYRFPEGGRVLELGCGTGELWKGRLTDFLKKRDDEKAGRHLVLSDFSEGMLSETKKNLSEPEGVTYQTIDIQNIPYPEDSFDVIIANMMLYHVPDLSKGLSEVRRVLKKGGAFYTATYGVHGILDYIASLLTEYGVQGTQNKSFTLQNGAEKLSKAFETVKCELYEDSLAVTNLEDLLDYLYSVSAFTDIRKVDRDTLWNVLNEQMVDGVLVIPKEYGTFICA